MGFQCPNCGTELVVSQGSKSFSQPKPQASPRASTNNLGAMIDHIEEKVMLGGAQLSDWEHNFLYEVEDDGRLKGVAVRFRKFGSETRMTDRQMDCLRKIYTKIGVD